MGDVGLARTSTGARPFACLKGALDGGLNIPHSEKRFRGYDPDQKEYSAEMQEEDPDKYAKCFSKYIEAGIEPDNLEDKWLAVHEAIRENPERESKKSTFSGKPKRFNDKKITLEQRKANVQKKLAAMADE